jgi:trk system potassium uptake protein TrkA
MRIAIAGAGVVGRSIARDLSAMGHHVLLIESSKQGYLPERVPEVDWMWADACELQTLEAAQVGACDVVIATTGDDKVNLVVSLLAKTEFAVPRVIARVNDADNQWMFNETWGVDVGVSMPRTAVAVIECVAILGGVASEAHSKVQDPA